MKPASPHAAVNQFVWLYALAWAGGSIAYTPLLTLLLPLHVAKLAGQSLGVQWMAQIALTGAIAASLAGIGFGYLSDLTRNRRGWIGAGLVLSSVLLVLTLRATSLPGLIICIVAWQMALNMMLGPLAALAGDVVPNEYKGILGGFMAFAPALGALSGALVTQPGLVAPETRTLAVAGLVCACVLPVLLFPIQKLAIPSTAAETMPETTIKPDFAKTKRAGRMWLGRMLIQTAEATMFTYLLFWLVGLDPAITDNQTAQLFSLILMVSIPIALITGRWSDVRGRPIAPVVLAAFGSALGLGLMAIATKPTLAIIAYGVFGVCGAVFLALHSAQTLRVLPRLDRRGRDLGVFNLANTLPALVMPWLAMAVIPRFGFEGMFALLAFFALAAAMLLLAVDRTD